MCFVLWWVGDTACSLVKSPQLLDAPDMFKIKLLPPVDGWGMVSDGWGMVSAADTKSLRSTSPHRDSMGRIQAAPPKAAEFPPITQTWANVDFLTTVAIVPKCDNSIQGCFTPANSLTVVYNNVDWDSSVWSTPMLLSIGLLLVRLSWKMCRQWNWAPSSPQGWNWE